MLENRRYGGYPFRIFDEDSEKVDGLHNLGDRSSAEERRPRGYRGYRGLGLLAAWLSAINLVNVCIDRVPYFH